MRICLVHHLFIEHYTNMPCQCGYPDGMSPRRKTILPRGDIPSGYPHWHGIFVLLYQTNPNLVIYQRKQQWLPVDPVRTVDVSPVDISPVDIVEWPTFVSQLRLTIFTWGIIKLNMRFKVCKKDYGLAVAADLCIISIWCGVPRTREVEIRIPLIRWTSLGDTPLVRKSVGLPRLL